MIYCVLQTAGSVDDGKAQFIGRLYNDKSILKTNRQPLKQPSEEEKNM
jgi:sulfate adenylyltransferase subunit 1 (EFTu-like GTPase family)